MAHSAHIRDSRLTGVTLSEDCYGPQEVQPPHAHDFTGIAIVLRGGIEEQSRHSTIQAGPCSVVVKPAGTTHGNRFGPDGARLFAVRLRNPALDLVEGYGRFFERYDWFHAGPAAAITLRLYQEFRSGQKLLDLALQECLCELSGQFESPLTRSGQRPGWLARVVEYLDHNYDAPVQIRDVAREADVHPVYLARAFRKWYGCSMTQYLRRRRIHAACSLIAAESASLSAVALQTGFADQPHFQRVFKSETGLTPNGFRQLIRRG